MEMFQNRTVLFAKMSTIWENTDGCADQYICTTDIYVLSMLAHSYNIIIDHVVGATVHGRESVGGFNATNKRLLSMLIITLQLPGAAYYDSQMAMHTSTANIDIILVRGFQKNIPDPTRAHVLLDWVKGRKNTSKRKWTEHEYNVQDIKDVTH